MTANRIASDGQHQHPAKESSPELNFATSLDVIILTGSSQVLMGSGLYGDLAWECDPGHNARSGLGLGLRSSLMRMAEIGVQPFLSIQQQWPKSAPYCLVLVKLLVLNTRPILALSAVVWDYELRS